MTLSLSGCNGNAPAADTAPPADEASDSISEASENTPEASDDASEASGDATDQQADITAKDMTWYLCKEEDTRTQPVYFVGDSDVPYISLEDWAELYPYLLKNYVHLGDEDLAYGLDYSREGETGTLTRTDGDPYTMIVDCDADTITFLDYDAFQRLEAAIHR